METNVDKLIADKEREILLFVEEKMQEIKQATGLGVSNVSVGIYHSEAMGNPSQYVVNGVRLQLAR